MADDKKEGKPAIIIKKGGHGGHHGGAWKIAYADFTTAMMCFFLCMWLINTASVTTRQAIASYFRKPSIFQEGSGQPLLLGGQGILSDAFKPPREHDKRKLKDPDPDQKTFGEKDKDLDKLYMQEALVEPRKHRGPTTVTGLNSDKQQAELFRKEIRLRIIAEDNKGKIEQILNSYQSISKTLGKVMMTVEPNGLKIDIMDTDKYSMFESGSARIRPDAEPAFKMITDVIKRYPNTLEVYGHTDSQPFPSRAGYYTNWELSSDRANAARRLLETQGYPSAKIISVTGKASTEPRNPTVPTDPSNRRITLKLNFAAATDFLRDEKEVTNYVDPLKELLFSEPPASQLPVEAPAPTPNDENAPATTPQTENTAETPPVASPTAEPSKSKSSLIQIPEGTPKATNPDFMPKDKIFDESPVIGSRDLFSSR